MYIGHSKDACVNLLERVLIEAVVNLTRPPEVTPRKTQQPPTKANLSEDLPFLPALNLGPVLALFFALSLALFRPCYSLDLTPGLSSSTPC